MKTIPLLAGPSVIRRFKETKYAIEEYRNRNAPIPQHLMDKFNRLSWLLAMAMLDGIEIEESKENAF